MTNKRAANTALRAAIAESRQSYDQLARDIRMVAAEAGNSIRTNKSALAQWCAGKRPSAQTAAYIAEALSRRLGRTLEPAELGLTDEQALSAACPL